ncbi:hypothetical protein Plhal304r1_c006g0024681 [Plasmopara halstedii]
MWSSLISIYGFWCVLSAFQLVEKTKKVAVVFVAARIRRRLRFRLHRLCWRLHLTLTSLLGKFFELGSWCVHISTTGVSLSPGLGGATLRPFPIDASRSCNVVSDIFRVLSDTRFSLRYPCSSGTSVCPILGSGWCNGMVGLLHTLCGTYQ